jgi:IS5 family transposase
MEEALYEITPMRQFARLTMSTPIPEDTTSMNFRHLLEKHKLALAILALINGYLQEKGLSLRQGNIVDASIIHSPSTIKNEDGKRDPEMHQTKGNQYFFGMKAHIGADAESGLVWQIAAPRCAAPIQARPSARLSFAKPSRVPRLSILFE